MSTAEPSDVGEGRHCQRVCEMGADMFDDTPNRIRAAIVMLARMRSEKIIIEDHRCFVRNSRSGARCFASPVNQPQAARSKLLDRGRMEAKDGTSDRLNRTMNSDGLLACHGKPEEFPSPTELNPISVVMGDCN
jgi:hypothetical protein